jgi:hypothetical protein
VSEDGFVWIMEEKLDHVGGKWFPLQLVVYFTRKDARVACRRYRDEGREVRVRRYVHDWTSK